MNVTHEIDIFLWKRFSRQVSRRLAGGRWKPVWTWLFIWH